jgi:PAS domain S-box-containing protein
MKKGSDQASARNALAQERDLLQSVMDSAGKAHLVYLDRDFNFVRVNQTYAATCGYRPEEMIGKNHFVLYPSAEMEAIFSKVRDTGVPVEIHDRPFEFPDQPERGVTYWDWTLIPTRDVSGHINGLIFSLFETTSRVRAEMELQRSEARYRMLYETMRDPFVQVNMDGRIVDCNEAYCQMLGYTPDEIKSLTYQQLTPDRWHEFEAGLVRDQIIARGYSDIYEKEYRRKDGTIFPVEIRTTLVRDAAGQPAMMWAIARDITRRRQVEAELTAANRLVQSIIDKTTAIIFAFDLEERFILANITLAKLFNTTPENMIGKKRHDFMPKEEADWHEENDRKVLKAGKAVEFEEYSNINGRSITWLTTKFPLYDESGQVYAVAGISPDISERKKLEDDLKISNATLEERVRERTEDLQRINEALLKSNKELENFAYITSHDLQEPLRMVTSFTQLLARRYENQLDQNANEYIGFAVDGAKRMYELINGLLEYSRISRKEARFTDVDLNEVIEEVRSNLKLVTKERNCLIETMDLPDVCADRTQMVQLFQNLISNGIKFSIRNPHITVSCQKNESGYVFSVKDDGIGIESEYHDRIFEIFKRLHHRDVYEGTGIGLAICKKIVENHNGKIWVESEPGRGSVFSFTLPGN